MVDSGSASLWNRCFLIALFTVLMMLGSSNHTPSLISSAQAHDFGGSTNPDPEDDPPDEDPPCQDRCCNDGSSGDPVFLLDGGERPSWNDLAVNGLYPIRVVRHYDSQSTYDSPLGYGWAFTHDRRLFEYPDGSVVMRRGCGHRDEFEFTGGAYVTPSDGVRGQLTEHSDGTFRFRYYDGAIDEYDAEGRLVAEVDPSGNRHEFLYEDPGSDGHPDKFPLTGTSPSSVDPNRPMVVAYVYHLSRIRERAADGSLTGRYVDFGYDTATGRLTSVTADDGRSLGYAHDETAGATRGNLVQVDGLEGIVSTFGYEDFVPGQPGTYRDDHNLTSIRHAQGETPVVNIYDDSDRVVTQTRGYSVRSFDYSNPRIQSSVTQTITSPDGTVLHTATTSYQFDSDGFITRETDALGNQMRYGYDAAKNRTSIEQWDNSSGSLVLRKSTMYGYNARGDRISETTTLDSGEVVTRSWSYDQGRITCEQSVSSLKPTDVFRTNYQLGYDNGIPIHNQAISRLVEATTTSDDDGDGVLTCADTVDGTWQSTVFSYDAKQRLLVTTLPDGVQVVNDYADGSLYVTRTYFTDSDGIELLQFQRQFAYDNQGNRTDLWDAEGNNTHTDHDAFGRVASITNALGEQTIYTYTANNLTQIELGHTVADGEGQVAQYVYDGDNNLIEIQRKDEGGDFVTSETYTYDSMGNRLSATDGEDRTKHYGFDVLGRLRSFTDPLGNTTAFDYDAAGNLTKTTDALLRETRNHYDDLDRLVRVEQAGIDPAAITQIGYDAAGNILSVTDPEGNTTSFTYDSLSRQLTETKSLGQTLTYVYNSRDRLDYRLTARGYRIDYDYTPWGPVTKHEVYGPDNTSGIPDETIAYDYDHNGNLTSVAYDAVQQLTKPLYTITYDALNRADVTTVGYIPNITVTLDNDYDRYGNRSALTVNDGESLVHSYDYDKLDRLLQARLPGSQTINLDYYANDQRQTIHYPSGSIRTYSYFANGPVQDITIRNSAAQVLEQFIYTYDSVLNVSTQTDSDGAHDYIYDGLDRLTQATHPTGVGLPDQENFDYDQVGNREDTTDPTLYDYDTNNRVLQSPGLTYSFDDDGSQTGRSDGSTYRYNAYNRFIAFNHGETSAAYAYSPMGQRLNKSVGGQAEYFLWDGKRLIGEYDASGNRLQRYAYLPADYLPVQTADTNGIYDAHGDRLQTPRLLTDAEKQVLWRLRSKAYGQAIVDEDADGDGIALTFNQRFPGQYFDEESKLHYNFFRHYDPSTLRYLESDPVGLAGGLNAYAYVRGNPLRLVDPLGLDTYRQDRELGALNLDNKSEPLETVISHTFIYTTNDDGSLEHTYSWGNSYDDGVANWHKDAPEDLEAARLALEQRRAYEAAPWWKKPFMPDNFGPRVGDSDMDERIEEEYQKRSTDKEHSSRHGWRLWNNCKHEATRLTNDAKSKGP